MELNNHFQTRQVKMYKVGGCVRDELMGLYPKDIDWVVVGASPEYMIEHGYSQVGADFPVFLHPETKEEYALARTERSTGYGYTDFETVFGSDVTLENDLLRRDLTINAIAYDQDKNVYIDPYGGISDIKNKILRHTSKAFMEDPLRILRIARFRSRYKFDIANETKILVKDMIEKDMLNFLPKERIWSETYKALSDNNPMLYIKTLEELGALAYVFPNLNLIKLNNYKLYQEVLNMTYSLSVEYEETNYKVFLISSAIFSCGNLLLECENSNDYKNIIEYDLKRNFFTNDIKKMAIDLMNIGNPHEFRKLPSEAIVDIFDRINLSGRLDKYGILYFEWIETLLYILLWTVYFESDTEKYCYSYNRWIIDFIRECMEFYLEAKAEIGTILSNEGTLNSREIKSLIKEHKVVMIDQIDRKEESYEIR